MATIGDDEKLLALIMGNDNGKINLSKLAEAMIQPIRKRIGYQSLGQSIFTMTPIDTYYYICY